MDVVVTKKLRLFFITAIIVFTPQQIFSVVRKVSVSPNITVQSSNIVATTASKTKDFGDAVVFLFPEQQQIQAEQKKLTIQNLENIKKLLKIFQTKMADLKKQQEADIQVKELLTKEVKNTKDALALASAATQVAATFRQDAQTLQFLPLKEVSLEPLVSLFSEIIDTIEELLKMITETTASPIQELDLFSLDDLLNKFDSEMKIKKELQQEITKLIGQNTKQLFATNKLLLPVEQIANLTEELNGLSFPESKKIDFEEIINFLQQVPIPSSASLKQLTTIQNQLITLENNLKTIPDVAEAANISAQLDSVITFLDEHVFAKPKSVSALAEALEDVEKCLSLAKDLTEENFEKNDSLDIFFKELDPLFLKMQTLQEEIDSLKNRDNVESSTFEAQTLEFQKTIDDLETELEKKDVEIQTITEKIEALEVQSKEEAQDKQRALDDFVREKAGLQSQLKNAEEAAKALDTERQKSQSLSKEKEQIQMQAQAIAGQAQAMYSELQRLNSVNQALTAQLQQLSSYLQAFSQENNQLKQLIPGYQQQIASLQSQLQMLSGFMNQLQSQGMNSPAMNQMMMQLSMMQEKQNQLSKEQQQKEIDALQRNQASLEVDNKLNQLRQTLQETKNAAPLSTSSPISQQIVLNAGSPDGNSASEKSSRSNAFLIDEKDDSDNFWQNYRTRVVTLGDTVSRVKKQIEANESNLSAAQKAVGELQQKRQFS